MLYQYLLYLILLVGYIIILWPSGYAIRRFLENFEFENKFKKDETGLNSSQKHAGTYIGYFERFLILTFMLTDQFVAIGFLITAKSIFRFEKSPRGIVEYFLIGTLMSYAITISVGEIMKYLILMIQS